MVSTNGSLTSAFFTDLPRKAEMDLTSRQAFKFVYLHLRRYGTHKIMAKELPVERGAIHLRLQALKNRISRKSCPPTRKETIKSAPSATISSIAVSLPPIPYLHSCEDRSSNLGHIGASKQIEAVILSSSPTIEVELILI
ncbi:unnamed protein product, partial [Mesorhabditis belari]|uniref:Uncharacterized protein n=1 Tax=Mesorhabditis belari TaxID=2138241 RepID=A0AAF3FNE0_9BILA